MKSKIEILQENDKKLIKLSGWSPQTISSFVSYLAAYHKIPKYKKLLNNMIDAKSMYQPITRGVLRPDIFGELKDWNEYRAIQRSQVYMHKRDIISSVDPKKGRRLIVTSRGHNIYYQDYPLAKLRSEKWDEYWTVVMYDFPERIRRERKYLRRKLMGYGFGSPQISILVSPLPLADTMERLIRDEKLEKNVWVLRAEGVLGLENHEVAQISWPLNQLNRLYSILLSSLTIIKKEKDRYKLLKSWGRLYLAVNHSDPHLPFELLPKDWLGEKCRKRYQKEFSSLGMIKTLLSFY